MTLLNYLDGNTGQLIVVLRTQGAEQSGYLRSGEVAVAPLHNHERSFA